MPIEADMPADPFIEMDKAIQESNLQRDIDAVDWQNRETGRTWAGYLGEVIELLEMGEFSSEPLMEDRVTSLEGFVPILQDAERLGSPDLPGIKRDVMVAVQETMKTQRVLMDTTATKGGN